MAHASNEGGHPPGGTRPVAKRLALAAGLLAAAAVVGVVLIFHWVDGERERALRGWQERLSIVAESRAAAVAGWLAAQRDVVSSLGADDTVRLYVADIAAQSGAEPDGRAEAAVQAQYLESLLVVTAARSGFAAEPAGPEVRANVERTGRAGLAILDPDLRVVVATPGLPPLTPDLRAFLAARSGASEPAMHGPFPGAADGAPAMAFAAPLRSIQDDAPAGLVVGIRPVAGDLYGLLDQPGATEVSAEAMLLEVEDAAVRYLSPLADGSAPLARSLALDTPNLAAAFAVRNPGGFGAYRDYRDLPVLVASRAIPGSDWVLAYKIDRAEALGETDRRLTRLLAILLLAVALTAAGVVAAWRHGVSRRAEVAAARYREVAERFEQQARFIRMLTDAQPNAVFIVDADDRVTFANQRLAGVVGATGPDDLVGKTMVAVFGPVAARRYGRAIHVAFAEEESQIRVERVSGEGLRGAADGERVLHTQFVHLPASAFAPAGVLVVEQDISEAIGARERNERLLEQLSETLLAIVDRRDPYAAHQSARVAEVARTLARDMALDPVLVDTVGKAASLMNIGKILVPRAVLMKTGRLEPGEIEQVRGALAAGVDLLEGVEFDGPVVETLRQTRAHVDGSGEPEGLAGDDILVTARIVAVANAFVGMVSPRAHRAGMDFDAAIDVLLAGANATWDRGVVGALINRLDNLGGRASWAGFSAPPPGIHGVID